MYGGALGHSSLALDFFYPTEGWRGVGGEKEKKEAEEWGKRGEEEMLLKGLGGEVFFWGGGFVFLLRIRLLSFSLIYFFTLTKQPFSHLFLSSRSKKLKPWRLGIGSHHPT